MFKSYKKKNIETEKKININQIIYMKLGSAGSLNESSSCSKIESSCDSNQSVVGSTNSDRDKDADLVSNKLDTESDIEILSNPSQSSIEVLDR